MIEIRALYYKQNNNKAPVGPRNVRVKFYKHAIVAWSKYASCWITPLWAKFEEHRSAESIIPARHRPSTLERRECEGRWRSIWHLCIADVVAWRGGCMTQGRPSVLFHIS